MSSIHLFFGRAWFREALWDACNGGDHCMATNDHFRRLVVTAFCAHRHCLCRQVASHSCRPSALARSSARCVTRLKKSLQGSSSYCAPSSFSLHLETLCEDEPPSPVTLVRRRLEPHTIRNIFLWTALSLFRIPSFIVHASQLCRTIDVTVDSKR